MMEGLFLYKVIGAYKVKNTFFYIVAVWLDWLSLAAIFFLMVFQVNLDSVLVFYVVPYT